MHTIARRARVHRHGGTPPHYFGHQVRLSVLFYSKALLAPHFPEVFPPSSLCPCLKQTRPLRCAAEAARATRPRGSCGTESRLFGQIWVWNHLSGAAGPRERTPTRRCKRSGTKMDTALTAVPSVCLLLLLPAHPRGLPTSAYSMWPHNQSPWSGVLLGSPGDRPAVSPSPSCVQ